MLWSCSTWSFTITTSGVTTIILETAFLCNALINLGKNWKIKSCWKNGDEISSQKHVWRQSCYPICAVIQPCVTRLRMTFARARHIAFLVCVNNPLVLTGGVKFGQSEVYQILVYRHELFKINFTGVPSSSSPVSPRIFPAFRSLYFSLPLQYSYLYAWNRLS